MPALVVVRFALSAAQHHSAQSTGPVLHQAPRGQKTDRAGTRPGVLKDPEKQLVDAVQGCECAVGGHAGSGVPGGRGDRLLLPRRPREAQKEQETRRARRHVLIVKFTMFSLFAAFLETAGLSGSLHIGFLRVGAPQILRSIPVGRRELRTRAGPWRSCPQAHGPHNEVLSLAGGAHPSSHTCGPQPPPQPPQPPQGVSVQGLPTAVGRLRSTHSCCARARVSKTQAGSLSAARDELRSEAETGAIAVAEARHHSSRGQTTASVIGVVEKRELHQAPRRRGLLHRGCGQPR